jgi:hypothetical protein
MRRALISFPAVVSMVLGSTECSGCSIRRHCSSVFIGTGAFGITDLAYDSGARRLIAALVRTKCYWQCGPETGMIWSIDPLTAQSVL